MKLSVKATELHAAEQIDARYGCGVYQALIASVLHMQDTWSMLIGGDTDGGLTAVAVGIAKLGEPAVMASFKRPAALWALEER